MSQKQRRTAQLTKAANSMQDGQARALDTLAEFESFREMFAPEIRKDIAAGMSDQQILKKYKHLAAGRLAQIAIAGGAKESIAATRELFDRVDGKPPVKLEHTHKLQHLSDAELDALLESQQEEMKTIEATAISVTEAAEEEENKEE